MKHITYVFLIPARLSLTFAPSESNALESMQPFIIERGSVSINTILVFHTLLQRYCRFKLVRYSCQKWRQFRIHDTKARDLHYPPRSQGWGLAHISVVHHNSHAPVETRAIEVRVENEYILKKTSVKHCISSNSPAPESDGPKELHL